MSAAASSLDLDTFCARYLAAWNDHDPGAMGDLITDDIVWEDPALPGPARGVAEVQEFMRGSWVAFPDLRFDETDAPHRRGRSGRLAVADARDDERPSEPAGVRADGPLDGDRGRRPVGDARRAHRPLPSLLGRQRPGAPARHRARARQPRAAGHGPPAAPAGADAQPARMTEADFDAVIVGASVAGCTAARLFAQRGARVALVERRPDLDAYKTV